MMRWAQEANEHQDCKAIVVEAMAITMSHEEIATDIRSLFSMGITVVQCSKVKALSRA